jgi:hypothetical protein
VIGHGLAFLIGLKVCHSFLSRGNKTKVL